MKLFDKILGILSILGCLAWMVFFVYIVTDMGSDEFRRGIPTIFPTFIWLGCTFVFVGRVLLRKFTDPEVKSINKEIISLKKKIEKEELERRYNELTNGKN